ncbi:MAG: thioesterase family protein [Bacteroidota bacterium]
MTSQIRVRYADTDQMKSVYYAKYYEYFEQGRSDLLREIGMPYSEIEALGYFLPVVESHARYISSARYDNLIEVKTIVREIPAARIRIDYEIRRAGETDLLVEGYTVHSFVKSDTGRPTRAPASFIKLLQSKFE